MQKVTQLIDIKAPCQEVFETVIDIHKRMQLSPLWGLSQLLRVTPDYPEPGSSYRVQVLTDAPFGISQGTLDASQNALAGFAQALFFRLDHTDSSHPIQTKKVKTEQSILDNEQKTKDATPVEQKYFIEEIQPPHKFSYHLDDDCKTVVTWRFQSIPFGTRINYEEVFCDESLVDEDFIPTVRHVIEEWLTNIKRYSELRDGPGRKVVKWFLDRFYLNMRPDQRRVVLLMLYMQAIGLATFMVALIGWGIATLFF
jgi:hypothetical protein